MEATCSPETTVNFQRTTWRYISEDRILHNYRYENLKSYKTDRGYKVKAAFKVILIAACYTHLMVESSNKWMRNPRM
jgi:hypothetical protein